jgi:hypothetical protein
MKATFKKDLWLKRETDQARLFFLDERCVDTPANTIWIPRSVVPLITKQPVVEGQHRKCTVQVEEWWWRKNGPEAREAAAGQKMLEL